MYRRELVQMSELEKWFSRDVWPDYPTHMLYARHGSIKYFPRPMAVYRQGGKGAWTAAGEKARLQKALTVREYLLDEFGDSSEAQEGLRFAMDNIRRAMQDIDSGMRLTAHKPLLKHLLTACRKAVSLFVPLPRP